MLENPLEQYQDEFASQIGAKAARATALGRQALVLLLKALDIKEGDEIGVCAFTCLSVAEAVKVTGAIPVYLDVDEHLCIDPDQILKHSKNSLKAVILQHTFGNPGRLDELLDACNYINAIIIEDCAHALGSYWGEKHLGCFGSGAIFSFQWGKPYTTGQGGMLICSSELIAEVDQMLETWAVPQQIKSAIMLEIQRKAYSVASKTGVEFYIRSLYKLLRDKGFISGSFKLDSDFKFEKGYIKYPDRLTLKEGLKQLKRYPEVEEKRRKTVCLIENMLEQNNIPIWQRSENAKIIILRYPIFVENKNEILQIAAQKNLDIAGWYNSPVHPLKNDDLVKVNYAKGMAPDAEIYIEKLIHLPTYNVTEEDLELMINTICNEIK